MLKGLKVIDYATYVAAPGCAGILAELDRLITALASPEAKANVSNPTSKPEKV